MSAKSAYPLKFISFCIDCTDPDHEGSLIRGLVPRYGVKDFSITGEVVYCVPNYVESPRIANAHHLYQKIVFVDRGEVSFYEKIIRIQEQTNALGVIIADFGDCDESFQRCQTPRLVNLQDGEFALSDDPSFWEKITIPVFFISLPAADRLRQFMNVEKQNIPGLGFHNVSKDSLKKNRVNPPPLSSSPPVDSRVNSNSLNNQIRISPLGSSTATTASSSNSNQKPNRNSKVNHRKLSGPARVHQESLNRVAGGSSMNNNPFVPPTHPPTSSSYSYRPPPVVEVVVDSHYLDDLRAIDEYHNQEFEIMDDHHSHHFSHTTMIARLSSSDPAEADIEFPFDEL